MSKIKETVLIIVGAVFAGLAVWQVAVPITEETVVQLVEIVFAILGALGIGLGVRGKWTARKLESGEDTVVNGVKAGYIGRVGDDEAFR